MKKISFALMVSVLFSPNAFSFDIGTEFSKNIIKIELLDDGSKIRYSYCEDKERMDDCELLGLGVYRVEDLKRFNNIQMAKAIANGLGTLVALPSGGTLALLGAAAIGTVGGAPIGIVVFAAGGALIVGGIHTFSNLSANLENMNVTSDSVLADEYLDKSVDYGPLLEKYEDDPFNYWEEERNALIKKRSAHNARYIHSIAERINAILERVEVDTREK